MSLGRDDRKDLMERQGEILGVLPIQWPPFVCESCEMETAGWVWEDGTKIGGDCKARLWGRDQFRGRVIVPEDSAKRKRGKKVKREVY